MLSLHCIGAEGMCCIRRRILRRNSQPVREVWFCLVSVQNFWPSMRPLTRLEARNLVHGLNRAYGRRIKVAAYSW